MKRTDTHENGWHRVTFEGDTYYITASDDGHGGTVRLHEREDTHCILAFDHPNPIGAAHTLALTIHNAETTLV